LVAVPGEFYFMAVGGLGVTLAGFAGLIAALQGTRGPVAAWRIRAVVSGGFGVTIVGFATVALFTITQDVPLTVRSASVLMVVTRAASWRGQLRPGAAWRNERQRRGAIFIQLVFAILVVVNIALASVGYLQLLLLIMLTGPFGVFALAVRDVTGSDPSPTDGTEEPNV
jgi:hypothetical protein